MDSLSWAKTLVGRDWEIWWSENEEADDKGGTNPNEPSEMEVDKDTPMQENAGMMTGGDLVSDMVLASLDEVKDDPVEPEVENEGNEENEENENNEENDEDSGSDGSVIDDWYAGRILSFEGSGESFIFKIVFVGDEQIYEMALDPTKVRPSAIAWIKRTKAILCSSELPSDEDLPPDTDTDLDSSALSEILLESEAEQPSFSLPESGKDEEAVGIEELRKVLRVKCLLRRQIHLRSKLAKIENHSGSEKYVDGEPNPTENYVNHLVQCCKDQVEFCDWFCRCWNFLSTVFVQESATPQVGDQPRLTIDHVVATFFETGKNIIMNFLSIDVESAVSKRRQPVTAVPLSARQSKRRKKLAGGSDSFQGGPTSSIADELLETIRNNSESFLMSIADEMMGTICRFVIDPALTWKHNAERLLAVDQDVKLMKSRESDDSVSEKSEDSVTNYVTLEEIKSAIEMATDGLVLEQLDTNPTKDSLQNKMDKLLATENSARTLLSQIGNAEDGSSDGSDRVLTSLQKIMHELEDSESLLRNVEPIGISDHPISRVTISEAIQLRAWLIKVWHGSKVRERHAFIEDLGPSIEELPDLSNLSEVTEITELASQVADAQEQAKAMVDQAKIAASNGMAIDDLWLSTSSSGLRSIEGVEKAAASLTSNSCIVVNEEKLALRRDVLQWEQTAKEIMSNAGENGHDFDELHTLYQDLEEILKGRSKGRMKLLEGVHPNTKIDKELERFAATDVSAMDGTIVDDVSRCYTTALQWKQRSESIITSLRQHGNPLAGEAIQSQKTPPMVDIKRVKDLIAEYKTLGVQLPGLFQILEAVDKEGTDWCVQIYQKLYHTPSPLAECLSFLLEQRELRPSGIIVDPARHLFDLMVETLTWYQRLQDTIKFASTEVLELSKKNTPRAEIDVNHSACCHDRFYPLLIDGIEVLQAYAQNAGLGNFATNLSQECEQILDSFGLRKTSKAIQLDKLQPHPLGATIISRLVGSTEQENQVSPLFVLIWYCWHLFVGDLVSRSENGGTVAESRQHLGLPPLKEALELLAKQPQLPSSQDNSPEAALIRTKTLEITQMEELISDANGIQEGIRNLLSQSKELLKDGFQKADLVQQHLANLKEYLASFRTQSKSNSGFSLDPSLDRLLDDDVKTFAWFVRTFSYPFLFLDEASFQKPVDLRIPWNVLVSLYERHPSDPGVQVGSFALVSLRVKELYEAGSQWQDEITKHTALTNRGGKRRVPGAGPAKPDPESEASSMLQMEEMGRLAKHPILTKIAMPRETAVRSILESSREFETQLYDFLGLDYEGASPDRASFPSSESLVGKGGEFILYRLTGSPLFEEVLTRQHSLSTVAEHVLADTRGKTTFEWISNAVSWIESLVDAVIDKSPFSDADPRISIPSTKAKVILQQGAKIFLTLPDDLKRTLSLHGIMVTTNKQDQTIKVMVKKDGAHHSCGGTVIRWCPILFEALRADTKRLERWESQMTKTLGEFNVFFKENRNAEKDDETLYKWFTFQEQVADLLENGHDALVVSPQKPFVSSFQNLLISFQKYLAEHSTPTKNQKFAMRWIAESNSIMDDRFLLLDSLLYRRSLVENDSLDDHASSHHHQPGNNSIFPGDSTQRNFRDSCRSYIEKALSKALRITGISSLPGLPDIDSFCAIKAWEIEGAMFERYQVELGISKISEEYRDKARSLRWSLEAKNNVSLCLRILVGEIKSESLLDMSSEELSSQKIKLKRAKAEQAARSSAMLTKPKSSSSEGTKAEPNQASKPATKDGMQVDAKDDGVEKTSADDSKTPATDETKSDAAESIPPASAPPAIDVSQVSLKEVAKALKSNKPPPPPPSLVKSSFQSTLDDDDDMDHYQPDPDVPVLNDTGGEKFTIEIVNLRLAFSATLYLEDENNENFADSQLMPSHLVEKGRLRIDEFSRFLHDKLAGGRWAAFALRVDILSDQRAYKKFYKEYETKKRIAMFAVSQNTKVFLVTPKFHRPVQAEGLTLSDKTSSYAIVLTKESIFVD